MASSRRSGPPAAPSSTSSTSADAESEPGDRARARGRGRAPTRTKLVVTLGPASSDATTIRALVQAGADVFRINCSHGDAESRAALVRRARRAGDLERRPVAILADLQGPKIRVGALEDDRPISLARGAELVIVADPGFVGGPGRIGCTYAGLARDVQPGEPILLDDGNLELEVLEVRGKEVRTKVRFGGPLKPHKGINLPGTRVGARALTAKDERDLAHVLELGVDAVALSFVRAAADVQKLRRRIDAAGSRAQVVAKIERPEGIERFEEILEASDAIMIARGDMGVEIGAEAVPAIQKRLIRRSVEAAKPVITATQMLESMIENPRPTRAEASDVANAIYDGTSAVMLSGESAAGKHPVRVVRTMERIARRAERDLFEDQLQAYGTPLVAAATGPGPTRRPGLPEPASIQEATVRAAARAALEVRAQAIVAFTESGRTARMVARERLPMRILGLTSSEVTERQLGLVWGVIPVRVPSCETVPELHAAAERELIARGHARRGDRVVLIGGQLHTVGATDTVRVLALGG